MTKNEFMQALRERTAALPREERERLEEYYNEIIDDCVEDGIDEEEAVAALRSPDDLMRELLPANDASAAGEASRPQSGEVVDALRSLDVRVRHADVTLRRAPLDNGAAAQVQFSDPNRFSWHMNGDALEIVENPPESKFSLFGLLDLGTRNLGSVTVTLAVGLEGALNGSSASGDLTADGLEVGGPASLSSQSGDVKLRGFACAGDVKLRTLSGDIDVRDARCAEVNLSTASGDIEIDRGGAAAVFAKSASGDVRIDEFDCGDRLAVDTASGDIDLSRCLAPAMQLNAISGDIDVRLPNRAGKCDINADTRSGRIRLPREWTPADNAGTCRVSARSVSGDITVTIVE